MLAPATDRRHKCLPPFSSGDKLYSVENLAWWKSVGAVEIGKGSGGDDRVGEEGKAEEGGVSPRNVFVLPKK